MSKKLNRTIAFALLALAGRISAATMLDITIQPVTVTPGQVAVAIMGTVTNNTGDIVFINGDDENLAAGLAIPASITDLFLATAPLSLAFGDTTGPMELFTFDVPAGAPLGSFNAGAFEVLGGIGSANQYNFDVVGTANVQVTVTPEPAGLTEAALGSALLGIAAAIRICRQRSRGRNSGLLRTPVHERGAGTRACSMETRLHALLTSLSSHQANEIYQLRGPQHRARTMPSFFIRLRSVLG